MKKILTMLAVILFCGVVMTSCNKDEKNDDNSNTLPTKADMVGTWEGAYSGTATINETNAGYTINWTLVLNAEGSNTVGSLKYTATSDAFETLTGETPVTDYYTRTNTSTGRIVIVSRPDLGLMDEMIDFDIDTKAKTFKGYFEAHTDGGDDVVTLGGETTLHKK